MAVARLADPEALRHIGDLSRPIALAKDQLLPVDEAFEKMLPDDGLKRGTTVTVSGPSCTSLALGLITEASRTGSWTAIVGLPWLGLVSAEELGVELGRVAIIDDPGDQWATIIAALVGAFDVVLTCLPPRVKAADGRRLAARLRERGTVLVQIPEPVHPSRPHHDVITGDVVLTVSAVEWEGLGRGHGRLLSRRIEVLTSGRGAATLGTRSWLWLPHRDGGVRGVEPVAATVLRPEQRFDSLAR